MLFTMPPMLSTMLYHMLYSFYLPCYIIFYIGLPPMLSTMLYTTYSVYHARMGGVAVFIPKLVKSIMGNNEPIITHYRPLHNR